jgi:alpha-tubulin suppressor-like RCC1 family protein
MERRATGLHLTARPGLQGPRAVAPLLATVLVAVVAVAGTAGAPTAGAATSPKAVYAWGDGGLGDAGNGKDFPQPLPGSVKGVTDAVGLATSQYQSLAVLGNGSVKAWGDDSDGELGPAVAPKPSSDITGATKDINEPVTVLGVSGAVAVSAGLAFDLALLRNGTVMAWGSNETGQLGNGIDSLARSSEYIYPVPTPVVGLIGVTAIAAGGSESLALLSNRTVMAWGDFDNEATPGHDVPVPMENLSGVKAIATGLEENLALLDNGTVVEWPANFTFGFGPPGSGANAPVQVAGLSGVTAISAGDSYYLALLKNGTVMAWGTNQYGQLGDGSVQSATGPVTVKGLAGVTVISAGFADGLALLKSGTVMAWGQNTDGVLGNGELDGVSDVPTPVRGLSGIKTIAAGTAVNLASQAAPRKVTITTANGLGNGSYLISMTPTGCGDDVGDLVGDTLVVKGGRATMDLSDGRVFTGPVVRDGLSFSAKTALAGSTFTIDMTGTVNPDGSLSGTYSYSGIPGGISGGGQGVACTFPFTAQPGPAGNSAPASGKRTATSAGCPTPAEVLAAWKASPGINQAVPGAVTSFGEVLCWRNWVRASALGDGDGPPFLFSRTGGLHGVTQAQFNRFNAEVCADPSAPRTFRFQGEDQSSC